MRKEKMQGVAASEMKSLTYDELQFCNDTALSLSNLNSLRDILIFYLFFSINTFPLHIILLIFAYKIQRV